MEQKFDFVEVTLDPSDYERVKEVYRLHKEQAHKLFDLTSGISTNDDIMDYIKDKIEYNVVLLGIDNTTGKYGGVVILEDFHFFNDEISSVRCHLVVSKKYWGKDSRQFILNCYSYLNNNMKRIRRMECSVPSNNYCIIKLLKDVGFKVEGTMKNKLVFLNKLDKPKYYNELMYSNLNIGDYNG